LEFVVFETSEEWSTCRRLIRPEFLRKVLDLLDAGRKVADVAADLGVTQQTIYNWRRQQPDRQRPNARRD